MKVYEVVYHYVRNPHQKRRSVFEADNLDDFWRLWDYFYPKRIVRAIYERVWTDETV